MKLKYLHKTIISVYFLISAPFFCIAQGSQHSPVYSRVINPVIPKEFVICNQVVDLDKVDYAERYDRELTSIIYTHGNTLLTIKRANRYFPQILPILKKNGIPEDLLYLACIESNLNPRAYSAAKAAGIWQFIPSTAKEYGLEVNDEVDERYNIDKATEAACRFFKKGLSRHGGDWLAVFQAYNGGMSRISSQLDTQQTNDALNLYLVEETQRYPFRIMAMKTVMENPAEYGFLLTPEQLYQPREVDIFEVSGPVESWTDWAKAHGISYNELRDENPWIRSQKLTNKMGKTYRVRVPKASSQRRSTMGTPKVFNKKWVNK